MILLDVKIFTPPILYLSNKWKLTLLVIIIRLNLLLFELIEN